jgi:hypothetical protein
MPGTVRTTRRGKMVMLATAGAIAAASVLAGCTTAIARFDDAIGQGIAAVETARLAVELQLDERMYGRTTTTALDDARRELVDAVAAVSETDAANESDVALRTDALAALTLGLEAVNDAHDGMAGIGSLEESVPPLERAAAALEALEPFETGPSPDPGGDGR